MSSGYPTSSSPLSGSRLQLLNEKIMLDSWTSGHTSSPRLENKHQTHTSFSTFLIFWNVPAIFSTFKPKKRKANPNYGTWSQLAHTSGPGQRITTKGLFCQNVWRGFPNLPKSRNLSSLQSTSVIKISARMGCWGLKGKRSAGWLRGETQTDLTYDAGHTDLSQFCIILLHLRSISFF